MQTQKAGESTGRISLVVFLCEICGEINSKTVLEAERAGHGECDFCGATFSPAVACKSNRLAVQAMSSRMKPR
jgi:hypothetical protein